MRWCWVVLLLLAVSGEAGTLRLWVRAPSTNVANDSCGRAWTDSGLVVVPGSTLSDLKEITVMGRRFTDPAEAVLGVIPAIGAEGDSIAFDLEIVDGAMGYLWTYATDLRGNRSCRGAEYVFAVPAVDVTPPPPPPPSTGSGLLGEYFTYDRWNSFKAKLGERLDPQINFDWGAGSAWPGGPADYGSIIWTGLLEIPATGSYTFHFDKKDGHRFYVDGAMVQNEWRDMSGETVNTLQLAAGPHAVRIEFYYGYSSARCRWSWSGPGLAKQIVPAAALSH
jgi:hypothetical protein